MDYSTTEQEAVATWPIPQTQPCVLVQIESGESARSLPLPVL